MIKVTAFAALYEGDPFGRPDMRASMLSTAAKEYYEVCHLLHQAGRSGRWRFNVMVPALQQSLELLVKSVAVWTIRGFDPKRYGHRILDVVDAHAKTVPVFKNLSLAPEVRELLAQLTDGYFAVRYGEAHVSYDDETWRLFCAVAEQLLAAARTACDTYQPPNPQTDSG